MSIAPRTHPKPSPTHGGTFLKTVNVDATDYHIFVSPDGTFYADISHGADELVLSTSLKALTDKLRATIRKLKPIAIEATLIREGRRNYSSSRDNPTEFRDVIVTGKHAGNGNPIYRCVDDNTTGQLNQYGLGEVLAARMTAAEKSHYLELELRVVEARERFSELRSKLKLTIKQLFERA